MLYFSIVNLKPEPLGHYLLLSMTHTKKKNSWEWGIWYDTAIGNNKDTCLESGLRGGSNNN